MTVTLLSFSGSRNDNTVTVNVRRRRQTMISGRRVTDSEPVLLRVAALRRPGRPAAPDPA